MIELKPCPFCGKKHPYGVEQESNFDRYYVWCDGCDTTGPRAHTPTEAIKAWNRRAEVKGDADAD